MIKLLLTKLGLGAVLGQKKIRKSPLAEDRERFERDVKDQFLKLKEKGLSIPVFTL